MKMKLEHYILGLLCIHPSTGYDLKRYLDTESRFERARAPLSQIYTTLKRMTENNQVSFIEEKREGKPDIKIYSITSEGKKYLIDFLRSPLEHSFHHNESSIFFQMRYSFLVEPEVIIKHIRDELDFRRNQIAISRHRDRTIQATSLSGSELVYLQAVSDELHAFGAAGMDQYIASLQNMLAFFENQSDVAEAQAVKA